MKKVKKAWPWPIAAIGVMALLGIMGWLLRDAKSEGGPPVPRQRIVFRLKWLIYSGFGVHFVAQERGLYNAQQLNVDVRPGGPGIDPLKLVLTGESDVGLASYDQILLARAKGLPLVAIGEDTVKSGVGFMSLAESGIKTPQDFIGRRVGVMPGTDKGTMYEALMAKLAIDRSHIIEIPVQFNPAVLFNGTVEVFPSFISNQPILARKAGFKVNVIDPDAYGITPGGNVFFTSETTLRKRQDALRRFLSAEVRATVESQTLPDAEVVAYVMKHNDALERDVEIEIWRATKSMLLPHDETGVGLMKRDTWARTAALFHQSGLLDRIPDLSKCYTNALVEGTKPRGSSG